jgi:Initiator Replication protein
LRVRVVDIARREINAKSDIAFEYEEIKTGRKVTALRFTITDNARADIPDPLRDDPRLARQVACLISHGMTREAARAIVQRHDTDLVEWATTDLARRLKGKEKIDNPAGWLRNAVEEDWRPQQTLFAKEQAEGHQAAQVEERRQRESGEEALNIRRAYSAYE